MEAALSGLQHGDAFNDAAATRAGKSLAPGTPVLMYDGSIKKVEDVVVGERLTGPNQLIRDAVSHL